ncbi:hypothetical protein PCE1_002802 [Barthelona sp. PCE]
MPRIIEVDEKDEEFNDSEHIYIDKEANSLLFYKRDDSFSGLGLSYLGYDEAEKAKLVIRQHIPTEEDSNNMNFIPLPVDFSNNTKRRYCDPVSVRYHCELEELILEFNIIELKKEDNGLYSEETKMHSYSFEDCELNWDRYDEQDDEETDLATNEHIKLVYLDDRHSLLWIGEENILLLLQFNDNAYVYSDEDEDEYCEPNRYVTLENYKYIGQIKGDVLLSHNNELKLLKKRFNNIINGSENPCSATLCPIGEGNSTLCIPILNINRSFLSIIFDSEGNLLFERFFELDSRVNIDLKGIYENIELTNNMSVILKSYTNSYMQLIVCNSTHNTFVYLHCDIVNQIFKTYELCDAKFMRIIDTMTVDTLIKPYFVNPRIKLLGCYGNDDHFIAEFIKHDYFVASIDNLCNLCKFASHNQFDRSMNPLYLAWENIFGSFQLIADFRKKLFYSYPIGFTCTTWNVQRDTNAVNNCFYILKDEEFEEKLIKVDIKRNSLLFHPEETTTEEGYILAGMEPNGRIFYSDDDNSLYVCYNTKKLILHENLNEFLYFSCSQNVCIFYDGDLVIYCRFDENLNRVIEKRTIIAEEWYRGKVTSLSLNIYDSSKFLVTVEYDDESTLIYACYLLPDRQWNFFTLNLEDSDDFDMNFDNTDFWLSDKTFYVWGCLYSINWERKTMGGCVDLRTNFEVLKKFEDSCIIMDLNVFTVTEVVNNTWMFWKFTVYDDDDLIYEVEKKRVSIFDLFSQMKMVEVTPH